MSLHINSHRLPFWVSNWRIFIVREANLMDLLTLDARIHFAKVFPLKYLTGGDILFIKLQLYCALASKKNQYLTCICILHKWKRNGPDGTQ